MIIKRKQIGLILYFALFIYSAFEKIKYYQKKETNLKNKLKVFKIHSDTFVTSIFTFVILLHSIGSIIIIQNSFQNNINTNIIKAIYTFFVIFFIAVNIIIYPINRKTIPFLTNLSLLGSIVYFLEDI